MSVLLEFQFPRVKLARWLTFMSSSAVASKRGGRCSSRDVRSWVAYLHAKVSKRPVLPRWKGTKVLSAKKKCQDQINANHLFVLSFFVDNFRWLQDSEGTSLVSSGTIWQHCEQHNASRLGAHRGRERERERRWGGWEGKQKLPLPTRLLLQLQLRHMHCMTRREREKNENQLVLSCRSTQVQ